MNFKQFRVWLWQKMHTSARFGTVLTVCLIATVVVFNTVIYGLSNRFSWYFYAEEKLEHTITSATDEYLNEVASAGQVRILFCDSEENLEADSVYNLVWQTANQLAARHDFIQVENVNIFLDPDEVEPYKYERDAETGEYVIDAETGKRVQINTVNRNSVIFVGAADYVVLPMRSFFVLDSDDVITAYNGEEITAAMIHRVQDANQPIAYFTVSHGETYASAFYNRLLCAGYRMVTVDLMTEELPARAGDLVVISNPQYDFVRGNAERGIVAELEKLEAFLDAGGSAWVMLDPLVTNTKYLEAFLSSWGITVERAEADGQREAVMVRDSSDAVTTDGYALITTPSGSETAEKIAADMEAIGAGRVIVSQASPLTLTQEAGKTVSALLCSSSSSRAYAAGKQVDGEGNYAVAAMSVDSQTGGGVFAVSSVYLTAEDAITTNEYGNKDLLFLLFRELGGVKVPTGCTYLLFSSTTLENLTMREARLWTVLIAGILPVAVIVCGVVILGKRRYR